MQAIPESHSSLSADLVRLQAVKSSCTVRSQRGARFWAYIFPGGCQTFPPAGADRRDQWVAESGDQVFPLDGILLHRYLYVRENYPLFSVIPSNSAAFAVCFFSLPSSISICLPHTGGQLRLTPVFAIHTRVHTFALRRVVYHPGTPAPSPEPVASRPNAKLSP